MEAIQGVEGNPVDPAKPDYGEPPPIFITGESHGVDRLMRSCVLVWTSGSDAGTHASTFLSDLGIAARVVSIGRLKWLLVFDNSEYFQKVLSMEHSWWVDRGFSMIPWTDEPILTPRREVWLKCYGIPLHASCPRTFLSIGQQWGEVLRANFGSVESGCLDDGRIKILTEIVTPFSFAFKLLVEGKSFDYLVVEENSDLSQVVQGCFGSSGLSGSRKPWKKLGIQGRLLEEAMADPLVQHRIYDFPKLSASTDEGRARGYPDPLTEVLSAEVACDSDDSDLPLDCGGGGPKEGGMRGGIVSCDKVFELSEVRFCHAQGDGECTEEDHRIGCVVMSSGGDPKKDDAEESGELFREDGILGPGPQQSVLACVGDFGESRLEQLALDGVGPGLPLNCGMTTSRSFDAWRLGRFYGGGGDPYRAIVEVVSKTINRERFSYAMSRDYGGAKLINTLLATGDKTSLRKSVTEKMFSAHKNEIKQRESVWSRVQWELIEPAIKIRTLRARLASCS
ncbi:hypothetical protein Dimus_024176 [Dionaea muscipula]